MGLIPLDWQALFEVRQLPDGDRVRIDREGAGGVGILTNVLTIRLDGVTWWKGVEVLDSEGQQIAFCETQDHQGAHSLTLDSPERQRARNGGSIVLWKAKTLGVHTPMYQLGNLAPLLDNHPVLTFTWLAD